MASSLAQLACPPPPEAIRPLLPPAQCPMRVPHCRSTLSVQWRPHARGPGRYPLTTKPAGPTSCPFDSPESPPTRPTRLPQPPACTTHTAKSHGTRPLQPPMRFSHRRSASNEARNSLPKRPAAPPAPATHFRRGPLPHHHLLPQ